MKYKRSCKGSVYSFWGLEPQKHTNLRILTGIARNKNRLKVGLIPKSQGDVKCLRNKLPMFVYYLNV